MFDHPRWGVIPCLATIHTIQEQEEVFVKYGYDLDYCPDWYLAAWEQGRLFILLFLLIPNSDCSRKLSNTGLHEGRVRCEHIL